MNHLGKIKLLPAREQVASVLRKAIISRELVEGQELILEDVSKQVGVSSMPVREALQILDAEGLIRLRPNKGAVVLGVNEKTIRDHFETRAILESEAASKACAEGADISGIEKAYMLSQEAVDANDFSFYGDQNQGFHFSIWEAAGNDKIINILSQMWNGLSMGHQVTKEEYARKSIIEHKQIFEAIKAHDEKKAKEMMYKHIYRSMNDILTRFTNT